MEARIRQLTQLLETATVGEAAKDDGIVEPGHGRDRGAARRRDDVPARQPRDRRAAAASRSTARSPRWARPSWARRSARPRPTRPPTARRCRSRSSRPRRTPAEARLTPEGRLPCRGGGLRACRPATVQPVRPATAQAVSPATAQALSPAAVWQVVGLADPADPASHEPQTRPVQRLAERRYCQLASGTKTSSTAAAQISV